MAKVLLVDDICFKIFYSFNRVLNKKKTACTPLPRSSHASIPPSACLQAEKVTNLAVLAAQQIVKCGHVTYYIYQLGYQEWGHN